MGKRKSRAKPVASKKRVEKLDTVFTCPFCNHGKSVSCEFFKEEMYGVVSCYVCKESWGMKTTPLTEAVDIYGEWIDECVRVNEDENHV